MSAVTNITVSHLSPLISYVPGMLWWDAQADPLKDAYQGKGYHCTNSSVGEGRLFFSWFGTDIWVYGGYRDRLGPYRVIVDGKHHDYAGYRKSDAQNADAVLFNSTGLKYQKHYMEIVNVGRDNTRPYGVFDLSHIVFEHHGKNTSFIDTSNPNSHWSSSGNSSAPAWMQTESSRYAVAIQCAVGSELHFPSVQDDVLFIGEYEYDIRRTGIMLYGAVGPSSSSFLASVDGVPQTITPNPQPNSSAIDPQLLFIYEGMEAGHHTLVVRNSPALSFQAGAPTTLNIHHALVFESSAHPPSLASDSKHANLVIGIVCSIAALVILVGLALAIRQGRRRYIRKQEKYTPRPFGLGQVTTHATTTGRRPTSILSYRLSTALMNSISRGQNHSYTSLAGDFDSNVATQHTSPSQMQEYLDDFSPTTTVFNPNPSRRNTAQLVTVKARTTSFSAVVQNMSGSDIPVPTLPPPPRAAGLPPQSNSRVQWPPDMQRPSTSYVL